MSNIENIKNAVMYLDDNKSLKDILEIQNSVNDYFGKLILEKVKTEYELTNELELEIEEFISTLKIVDHYFYPLENGYLDPSVNYIGIQYTFIFEFPKSLKLKFDIFDFLNYIKDTYCESFKDIINNTSACFIDSNMQYYDCDLYLGNTISKLEIHYRKIND